MRYIPKTIHLIWFGKGDFPANTQKCIDSWKKHFPDYEIKRWDEETFDITTNTFVEEAYKMRKWAYVSDYVRLYALYKEGGIYLDTDVEVVRNFDDLLENKHAVTGYACPSLISSGVIASEKKNNWIFKLLEYYDQRHFVMEDGTCDLKINNIVIAEVSKKLGYKNGDERIEYGNVTLLPRIYFQPYTSRVIKWDIDDIGEYKKYYKIEKDKTCCIHYCGASWIDNNTNMLSRIKHFIRRVLPQNIIERMEMVYYMKK